MTEFERGVEEAESRDFLEKLCPYCGKLVSPLASIRQGLVKDFNIIDVGYKCPECGAEWGYEVFSDVVFWKQSQARLKKKIKEAME